jgi:alpha-D-xyloside xylohydrolase
LKLFRIVSIALGAIVLNLASLTEPALATSYVQSFDRGASGVTIYSESGALSIEACAGSIVHVVASPTRKIPAAVVPTVVHECQDHDVKIISDKSTVSLRTPVLQVSVDRISGVLRFLTVDGKSILSEPGNGARKLTPISLDGTSTFRVQQTFLSPPDESLYGLGQHQEGAFDLRNVPQHLLQANTNIVIPFLLSTRGYGLLWNNPSLTDFNVAEQNIEIDPETGEGTFKTGSSGEYGFLLSGNRRKGLHLSIGGKTLIDIKNMWVADSAGAKIVLNANTEYKVSAQTGGKTKLSVRIPSDTTSFSSEAGSAVDYYFFYGPQPDAILRGYREMTGAAPLLPKWAYGFWQCRERYSSQQQILDTAAEFRKRKIPVDVLVQDWQYWGRYGWNAMRFDERDYPDPAQMMSKLHSDDIHLVASVWAKFGTETEVDQDMKKEHLVLASAAETGEPGEAQAKEDWADLFNPKAQRLFWTELNRRLFPDGLDGWWLDASEPEGDPLKNDWTFLGPGKVVRNAYPLYEISAVYNGQRATTESKRVVILSRSAFAGQQRYSSIAWSGDISGNWDTLRRQIPAGLSYGMSGFPYWTTDIGGFFRPADQYTSAEYRELLIRWFQYGAFCPIFRIHGYRSETELWKYGPEAEKILTAYDNLRYRLLPYIYSGAWGVTHRGEIQMRALPFAYPQDRSVRTVSDEFLFGDSLLVNPVTKYRATSRSVVLPAGDDWVNFWTGQNEAGGKTITVDSPLNEIPIMVKAGSIVPMGPIVQSAAEGADPLEIRIYGGKDADFELYEDSGDSYAYEHGAKATIHFHWDDHQKRLLIADRSGAFPGMRMKHTLQIVLVKPGHGVGAGSDSGIDRSVLYEGHRMTIDIGKRA